MNAGVKYATKSGTASISPGAAALVTAQHLDERTFAAYNPNSLAGAATEGVYRAVGGGRHFMLDMQGSGGLQMSEFDEDFDDVIAHLGRFYALCHGCIWELEGGFENQDFEYISGRMRTGQKVTYGKIKVRADLQDAFAESTLLSHDTFGETLFGDAPESAVIQREIPAQVRVSAYVPPGISAENRAQHGDWGAELSITDEDSFSIPEYGRADTYRIRVRANVPVRAVAVASNERWMRSIRI